MNAMGIIFANIYDSSLGELTNKRTMASLPYGGRYRQIDFSLSNMTNADIRHIGIMSVYKYQSLMNHIGSGQEWDLELEENGLSFLTPNSLSRSANVRGKLDALSTAMQFLEESTEEYVFLADSGVLCNIDLEAVLAAHIASGKDITVVAKAGIADGKKSLSLAALLDKKGEIVDMAVDYPAKEDYLASMGIFVLRRDLLIYYVREKVARSHYRFERDLVLREFATKKNIGVYAFDGLALFNESTLEYYHNNLALTDPAIQSGLFQCGRTIYTKVRDQVPVYYGENSDINECIVADGCTLEGMAEHSVFFRGVSLKEGAQVRGSVIMNNCVIGENAEIVDAILDKDVVVRPGVRLCGSPDNPIIVKKGDIV